MMRSLLMRAHNFKDLSGQKFGKLTVLSYFDTIRKKARFSCSCDCGKICIVLGNSLKEQRQISCGCHKRQVTKEFNARTKTKISYDTFSVVWQSYKQGAILRNIEFLLDKTTFYNLCTANCYYCGAEPSMTRKARVKSKGYLDSFIHNGVDRVDSSKNYTIDNCVTACKKCNRMKSDLSITEWYEHMKKIISYSQRSS